MFERYTQKARRVIFFARYEASNYGSPYIETEHLLLGLVREDRPLMALFLGQGPIAERIRAEVEQHITRRQQISTSVEVPLTAECKEALNAAAEEADRLGHRHVGTQHLLLGMMRVKDSMAARFLQARSLEEATVRERIAKDCYPAAERRDEEAKTVLGTFLARLKRIGGDQLTEFFSENAQFTDASGRCWNGEEIRKNSETLFAHYAKKNSAPVIETTLAHGDVLFFATVLWRNAMLASEQPTWAHRINFVLVRENQDWRILLLHVTPVLPS